MSELPGKPEVADDDAPQEVKTPGNGEVTSGPDADLSPAMEEAPPAPDPTGDARPTGNGGPAMVEAPPVGDDTESSRYPIDLEAQEGVHDAHVIERHVGRTDQQLGDRLADPRYSIVSSFTDLETAQRAVQATVDANESKIETWLDRPDRFPRETLGPQSFPEPVGRELTRADYEQGQGSTPADTVVLALQRADSEPNGFVVLTAMLTRGTEDS